MGNVATPARFSGEIPEQNIPFAISTPQAKPPAEDNRSMATLVVRTLRTPRFGRWMPVAVTLLLLGVLYWQIGWSAIGQAALEVSTPFLLLALLLFVPQTLVSALRWQVIASAECSLTFRHSLMSVLRSSAWNLLLPAKLGDFSKASELPLPTLGQRMLASRYVLYEKAVDVAALLVLSTWGASSWAPLRWANVAVLLLLSMMLPAVLVLRRGSATQRFAGTTTLSLLLWSLHLMQFDLFFKATGIFAPPALILARVPWAIFAGLVPATLWGVGTRDAVLIWAFSDSAPTAALAIVGALASLRYIVPGLVGLLVLVCVPFFRYLSTAPSPAPHFAQRGATRLPTGG